MRTQQSQIDLRYHIVETVEDVKRIKTAFAGSTALCKETGVLYEYKTSERMEDLYSDKSPEIINVLYYYQVSDAAVQPVFTHTYYTVVPGAQGSNLSAGIQLYADKDCTLPVSSASENFQYTGVTDAGQYAPGCWVSTAFFSNNSFTYTFDLNDWQYDSVANTYFLNLEIGLPVKNICPTFYADDTNSIVEVDNVVFTYNNDLINTAQAIVSADPDCRFSGKVCIVFDRIVL